MKELTAERLRELLHYDPKTGVFTWRVDKGQRARAGNAVTCTRTDGYMSVHFDGRHHKLHRLAWLHHYGVWPSGETDHKNGNHANNRIDNLRDIPHAMNMQNRRKARAGSAIGLLGVSRKNGRFVAQLMIAGKQQHLGMFDTPELAHAAYLEMKRKVHAGCTL